MNIKSRTDEELDLTYYLSQYDFEIIRLEDILKDQKKNEDLQNKRSKLISKHNVYYKKVKKKEKIILSENFSLKLIKDVHECYGHIGINQLQNKISQYYTAKNLTNNIKKFCKCGEICIKNKARG